jgi:hypothetical protein
MLPGFGARTIDLSVKPMLRATLGLLIGACALSAQPPLERVSFLLGGWTTDTDTELGHATALSTFAQELDRQILTRRGSTKYTSGKNAGQGHDDLLIVYPEGPNGGMKAIYFDAEGHVIHYTVTVPEPNTAVFDSDPAQPGPRYRLTHKVTGRQMETRFEVAAPGQTSYQTYVSGVSSRK